jgi:hypothetical protein
VITEWFLSLMATIGAWFMDLLPDADWSDGMVLTATNALSSVVVGMAALGAWFPWAVFTVCTTFVLSSYFVLFTLKIARQIWAYVPFVGGTG